METFSYGPSADDADKRELLDNRRDEEIAEVEGSDRVEGWRIRGGLDFDRLEQQTIMTFYEKMILPSYKMVWQGKADDHTVPIWTENTIFYLNVALFLRSAY